MDMCVRLIKINKKTKQKFSDGVVEYTQFDSLKFII